MSRLLVTWRSRSSQKTHAVGVLDAGDGFTFRYLTPQSLPADFRAFINFPDVAATYVSDVLFPFFAQRVMSDRRPDYASYLDALGLAASATQIEVLGRSGGRRKGDTVEVVEEPIIGGDGSVDHVFLVRGTRYQLPTDDALAELQVGSPLTLQPQPGNPINPGAQLVCTPAGQALGWVPDALLPFTAEVLHEAHTLTALRVNLSDWPDHMRLVVRLQGRVPTRLEPFAHALAGLRLEARLG